MTPPARAPAGAPLPPRHPHRLATFLLLVALAALIALSAGVHERIVALVAMVRDLVVVWPVGGAVVFVLLAALSAMLVLFSGVVLVPVGIEAWGETGCFLLLWAGWWLGGIATYAIGRGFGRPVIERLLPPANIAQYEGRILGGDSFATALLVLVSLPSDVVGYFFGLVRFRPGRYLLALALAELPYAYGTVFLGAAFMERRLWPLFIGGVVALAVFAWQQRMQRATR